MKRLLAAAAVVVGLVAGQATLAGAEIAGSLAKGCGDIVEGAGSYVRDVHPGTLPLDIDDTTLNSGRFQFFIDVREPSCADFRYEIRVFSQADGNPELFTVSRSGDGVWQRWAVDVHVNDYDRDTLLVQVASLTKNGKTYDLGPDTGLGEVCNPADEDDPCPGTSYR